MGPSKGPSGAGLGVHLEVGPGVLEFTLEAALAYVLAWSKGQNKGASIARETIARDKIPPPRGWAGHARVGRESGFAGNHIRDRTETPHRFLDEKVRVNART